MLNGYVNAVSEAFSKLAKAFTKEAPKVLKSMPVYDMYEATDHIQNITGIDTETIANVMAANDDYMCDLGITDFRSKPEHWIRPEQQ